MVSSDGFSRLVFLWLQRVRTRRIYKHIGNTVSFIIGNDSAVSKSTTRAAIYDLGSDGLSIIETVSSMDGASAPTKGTPVYTENFDALYGSSLYATAYAPSAGSGVLTDV